MSTPFNTNLISTKLASEISGYHPDYIGRLCRSGKINSTQFGRSWLVDRDSLVEFCKNQDQKKRENAEELSRKREQEYQIARNDHNGHVRLVSAPRTPVVRNQGKSIPSPFFDNAVAALVALVVGTASLYALNSPVGQLVGTKVLEVTSNAALGVRILASDIPEWPITDRHTIANVTVEKQAPIFTGPIIIPSVAQTDVTTGYIAVSDTDHTEKYAVNTTGRLPSIPVASLIASAEQALANPQDTLTDIYIGIGESTHSLIVGGLETYSIGLADAGDLWVESGYSMRDGLLALGESGLMAELNLGNDTIRMAQTILDAHEAGIYGFIESTPHISLAVLKTAHTIGDTVASAVASVPTSIASGYDSAVTSWVEGSLDVASSMETGLLAAAHNINQGGEPLRTAYIEVINGTGSVAYENLSGAISGTRAIGQELALAFSGQGPDFVTLVAHQRDVFDSAAQEHSGSQNANGALAAATAEASIYKAGEDVALYTYVTINNFFYKGLSTIASLFKQAPVAFVPLPQGDTTSAGTSSSYSIISQTPVQNIVNQITIQGVTFDYLERRLREARSSILDSRAISQRSSSGGGSGSVTSVDASGGTTGFSFTGGPITSSGTLTLSGTLDIDNGGTGITSAPVYGELLVGNGLGGYSLLATSSLGITSGGTPGGSDTQVQFNNAGAFGGDAGFTFNATGDRLTVVNASTTNLSSSYASSTNAFFGTLSVGSLTGILKATSGVVSAATAGVDYLTTALTSIGPAGALQTGSAITLATSSTAFNGLTASTTITATGNTLTFTNTLAGLLGIGGGGTGLTSYTSGDILYADGSGNLAKLPVGSPGQVLKVSGSSLPSWAADLTTGGGASTWATTTDDLAIYPSDPSDVVLIGASATSTTGNIFEVLGSSLFRGAVTAYNLFTAPNFTSTSTTAINTFPNLTTTNATSTGSLYITPLGTAAGTFLAADATGRIIATTSPLATAVTAIGPAGQTADGPTVTFATSTSVTNGITSAITIVGSGDTLTLTPSQSGTLTVAGGGTGQSTFTSGQLLYGNGTNALSSVATTSLTLASEFSHSGTIGSLIGGAAGTLSLTTNGVALTKLAQIAANTILGNFTGAVGNVTAFATSSLGIALGDTTGTLAINRGGTATTTFFNGGVTFFDSTLGTISQAATQAGLFFDKTNSRLGIGTTTPSSVLHVQSASTPEISLQENAAGKARYSFAASTNLATRINGTDYLTLQASGNFIVNSGNVGIGTTSPYAKLSVVGPVVAEYFNATSTTATSTLHGNSYGPDGIALGSSDKIYSPDNFNIYDTGNNISRFGFSTNNTYNVGSSGEHRFQINGSQIAVFNASGNVGIAQGSPTFKLDVTGSGRFTSLVDASHFVATSTSATSTFAGGLAVETSGLVYDYSSNNVGIGTTSPWAQLSVNPNGISGPAFVVGSSTATSFMVTNGGLTSLGGISSANQGTSVLGVNGNITVGSNTQAINTNIWSAFSSSADLQVKGGSSAINILFKNGASSAELARLSSAGNLGIGTTSPYAKLSVAGEVVGANFTATTSANNTFPNLIATYSTTTNATTTNLFSTTASSTNLFTSNLSIASLTGFLKATAGVVSTATIDLVNDVGSSILAVINGGTGWGNITANAILLGNGTSRLATTSAGTNGQVLALVGGVPTWTATTTAGTGLTYTGSAFNVNTSQNIATLSNLTTDGVVFTSGGAGTLNVDSGALDIARGGTGQTTFTSSQLLYGNGTNALSSVATTSLTLASEFSHSGTIGSLIGGAAGTLSLATNGTALTKLAQIAANSILGNLTGAVGNVTAFATSSLGIALSDTTGTLAVDRGGTGAATFTNNRLLTGNGTSALNDEANLTFDGSLLTVTGNASTTQLTTTGSTYLATTGGSVGIGTTGPTARLHAVGIANTYTGRFIGSGTTGQSYGVDINAGTNSSDVALRIMDVTGSASYLQVRGDGNIGIGTTTPTQKLQVFGNIIAGGAAQISNFASGVGITDYLAVLGDTDTDVPGLVIGNQATTENKRFTLYHNTTNDQIIFNNTFSTGGFSDYVFKTTSSDLVTIKSAGNVGIGTTTPGSLLSLAVASGDGVRVTRNNDSTIFSLLQDASLTLTGTQVLGRSSGIVSLSNNGGVTNINPSGGNVGIGTTTPYSKLSVWGANTTSGVRAFEVINSASTTAFAVDNAGNLTVPGASNNFIGSNNGHGLRFDGSGITGLTLNSLSGFGIIIDSDGTSSANDFWVGEGSTDPETVGAKYLTVVNGGNVGIGTSSPYAKLSVSGETVASHFTATTSATSTFPNISVQGAMNFFGTYATALSDLCTAITGGAGLCDGTDNTGGGGGLATSTDIADTQVIYGTSASDVGAEAAFTYDDATDKLTVVNASTTNISASYASSTQGFFGSLNVGSLTGFLKATAGVVSTATIDLVNDVGSSILAVVNGGTGWGNLQANAILLGNGTSRIATTSAGTNGQVLALVSGVPTWTATTTAGTGLTYTGSAFNVNTSQNIATLSNLTTDGVVYTSGGAGTLNVDSGALDIARGGTGQTTFTSSQLLYGNGTNALSSVATTSLTLASEFSHSGTIGSLIGGAAGTLSLATNGTALTKLAQIAANSILGNTTGAVGDVTAIATSSLFTWTGTGDVVRATSPTLVTPILGTPTSVTLTNGTGLPISTGVSGLAAGVATFLGTPSSANLVTAVTDETGTGALVFGTSPTISGATLSGITSISNASTTAFSANTLAVGQTATTTISSTGALFTPSLTIASLTGFLKATAGVVSTATIDLVNDVGSSILAVVNGGTGWGNITANAILLGNGTSRLATTSAGTNGQVLALVGGVPTWTATTTAGTGLTYSGSAFNVNTSQNIATLSNLTTDGVVYTSGGAGTLNVDSGALDIARGGTGQTTFTSSQLLYGNGTAALSSVATTTFTPSAEFTIGGTLGAFVGGANSTLTLATNGVALTKLAQIAANSILGNLTGAVGDVTAFATSSLGIALSDTTGTLAVDRGGTGAATFTNNRLLTGNGTSALVDEANLTFDGSLLTVTGNASTTGFSSSYASSTNAFFGNLSVGSLSGLLKATAGVVSAATAGVDFENPLSFVYPLVRSVDSISLAFGTTTANTWSAHNIFSSLFATNASSTNATTSTLYVTSLGTAAGTFLAADPNGQIIATTSPSGGGITAIGPTGQTSDGPTVTLATSSTAFNGLTPGLTITGSGDTLTFASALSGTLDNAGLTNSTVSYGGVSLALGGSDATPAFDLTDATNLPIVNGTTGTLTVARGGTGQTTFTSSQLLYGNGTSALTSVATTSATIGGGLTYSGTFGALVGGAAGTLAVDDVTPAMLQSADFGEFTCNGTTCSLDAESQSIEELSDVAAMTENLGDLLYWNGSSWADIATSSLNLLTLIGPTGQTSDGPTVTLATSTSATNGITSALTIVGSADTLTFTPSQSGTLTVAGGGTGATTLTGMLKGNGTGAFTAGVDGTDFTLTNAITCTNQAITAVTAAGVSTCSSINNDYWSGTDLSVANGGTGASTLTGLLQGNGTGAITGITGTTGQFPYYNGTNTLLATSTIHLSTSGNVGIGTTTPQNKLTVNGGIQIEGAVSTPNGHPGLYMGYNSGVSVLYSLNNNVTWLPMTIDASTLYLNQGSLGNVSVGTSTTNGYEMTLHHATLPQLALSSGAGSSQWTLRSINSNLYIATTSIAGTATSTTAALQINSSGTLIVGGGTGKITIGTFDPVYTIDGTAYATYAAGMIGIKEEVTGTADIDTPTTAPDGSQGYMKEISFYEEPVGSDLWLFAHTTHLQKNIDGLVVLLSSEGGSKVWYSVDKANQKVYLLSDTPSTVSYRFTAPRFDNEEWSNLNHDGVVGFLPPSEDDNDYFFDNGLISFGNDFSVDTATLDELIGYPGPDEEEHPWTSALAGVSTGLKEAMESLSDATINVFEGAQYYADGLFKRIFAKEVHTDKLCVSDETGETCITREQLDTLLAGAGISTLPPIEEEPEDETPPDSGGEETPAEEDTGGGVVEDAGNGEADTGGETDAGGDVGGEDTGAVGGASDDNPQGGGDAAAGGSPEGGDDSAAGDTGGADSGGEASSGGEGGA